MCMRTQMKKNSVVVILFAMTSACSGDAGGTSDEVAGSTAGRSREEIRYANERLAEKGYLPNEALAKEYRGWEPVVGTSPSSPDIWDESSTAALRAFQRDNALVADGELDDASFHLLENNFCGVPASSTSSRDKWALIPGNVFARRKLTYRLLSTDNLNGGEFLPLQLAMNTWAAVTTLTFTATQANDATADISFDFSAVQTAMGQTNGHAITFKRTGTWTKELLQGVALHEVGHAIGLHHSGVLPAVMGPSSDSFAGQLTTGLFDEDIVPANRLYGEWELLPGRAHDIGVGGPNQAWILGTNRVEGGYSIFRWDEPSRNWINVPGGAIAIDVAGGQPWAVNDTGAIFAGSNAGFSRVPLGCATDIGGGPDGSVWILGCNSVDGGHSIFKLTGSPFQPFTNPWTTIPGGGLTVDVDSTGRAWVANDTANIFRSKTANGGGWEVMPGLGIHLGIGGKVDSFRGSTVYPWVIGTNVVEFFDRSIHVFTQQTAVANTAAGGDNSVPGVRGWFAIEGGAVRVSADTTGRPWVVTASGDIYRRRRD
jgi:hypothetical protein